MVMEMMNRNNCFGLKESWIVIDKELSFCEVKFVKVKMELKVCNSN